jgi:alpha-galactosidase
MSGAARRHPGSSGPIAEQERRVTNRPPRIVFLGAGSVQFAPSLIVDFIFQRDLHGGTIAMVDVDEQRLALTHALARRLVADAGVDLCLEATTDRRTALPGSDAVIVSVELDRFETWESDRRIPSVHGVPQALGENGGPGGLMHSLRQIPPIVEICQDVERLCPGALVLNIANPMSRICQAVADATRARCVGLCHEIKGGHRHVARMLGVEEDALDIVAAGVNHFTWFLEIRDRATGADLYPAVRAAGPSGTTESRLLVSDLLRMTGWLCVTNDSHAGEYLSGGHLWRTSWAPETAPLAFYEWYRGYIQDRQAEIMAMVDGSRDTAELLDRPSGEDVVAIVADALHRRPARYAAVNVPNRGYIVNLPPGCIVEVPGEARDGDIHGVPVGELPSPIAEWCRRQVHLHKLTARAALEGDRRLALEAMLLDPVVPDVQTAERLLDAMLAANRRYLPRFYP